MISNPANPTIREISKLRRRRERERRGSVLVEGHRAVAAAVAAGATVRQVVHTRTASARRPALLAAARAAGARLVEVADPVIASISSAATAPDVIGVVGAPAASLERAVAAFGLGAVLAGVHDPAAAGAILASCAAAGGTSAISTAGTADLFAPSVLRAGAGAHFVLALAAGVEPGACARALRDAGVRLVALDPAGAAPADADLTAPVAVLVGDEGSLPEELAAGAAARVGLGAGAGGIRPPLSVEAAVVLFEAARRRAGAAAGRG